MILFPGFFSTAQEYADLERELDVEFQIFNYAGLTATPIGDLGSKICERIGKPTVAVGYSMGGRILLEALKHDPKKFSAVCLISTNPGLKWDVERKQRLMSDENWSQRFLSDAWPELSREWNAQGVFSGSMTEPDRREKDFDRKVLSETLKNWSLGRQVDHRKMIEKLPVPNLWIAGASDQKFSGFLKDINAGMKTQTRVIANAGHRVHVDQPAALARTMKTWLSDLFKVPPAVAL